MNSCDIDACIRITKSVSGVWICSCEKVFNLQDDDFHGRSHAAMNEELSRSRLIWSLCDSFFACVNSCDVDACIRITKSLSGVWICSCEKVLNLQDDDFHSRRHCMTSGKLVWF